MKCERKFKRKCCACGEYKDKSQLLKITKTRDGEIIVNPTLKQHGYSVYICKNQDCINQAIKNKRVQKCLKTNVSQDVLDKIVK